MFQPAFYIFVQYRHNRSYGGWGGQGRGGWSSVCSLVVSRTLPDLATVGVRSRRSRSVTSPAWPDNTMYCTAGRCSPDFPPALPNMADTWRSVFEPYLTKSPLMTVLCGPCWAKFDLTLPQLVYNTVVLTVPSSYLTRVTFVSVLCGP
jgi:hypothetical protein